jgi:1-acyl-sn-glycerol-3-phosphate acyltransferase
MDKTENNETEQQPKRPSARRHTPEPIEQPNVGKRVHARRTLNVAEPASEPRSRAPRPPRASARTAMREGEPRRVRASARDEVAASEASTAGESERARANEASARDEVAASEARAVEESERARASEASARNEVATNEASARNEVAASEASTVEERERARASEASVELEASASVVEGASELEERPSDAPAPQPSAAAPVVWHSDAAAPGHEREPIRTSSALVRHALGDDFGLDDGYEAKLRPWLETMCKRYFRVELHGAQNVPPHGRALLVSNHSRSLIWDGIILRTALRLHHDAGREMRWLVDDAQFHAPFLGTFINRLGAVRACQENAERLLLREELVAVFPEGAKAAEKRYEDRFRLQRFGRGGCVKLALRTGAPVLPVAIVAAVDDDRAWMNRLGSASRMLGAPLFALRPGLPRLGQLGVPPIASHFRITIGEPIREISRQDADATRDDGLVHELNEFVRGAVQSLVDETLRA